MEFLEGMLKIANVVLSIVAGYLAIQILIIGKNKKELKAWKVLVVALILFIVQEVLGALRAFEIFTSPFLTHIVPGILLAFLIYAIALQIHVQLTQK